MGIYKIGKDGITAIRNKFIRSQAIVFFILVLMFGYFYLYDDRFKDAYSLYVFPVILLLYFAWSSYRRIKVAVDIYNSLEIEVNDLHIIRRQKGSPDLTLSVFEISRMSRVRNGIIIRGESAGAIMQIPSALDNYDELEEQLEKIRPFDESDIKAFHEKFWYVGLLLMLGGFFGLNTSTNPFVLILSGIALLLFLHVFVKAVYRNRIFSDARRVTANWILYVISLVLIALVVLKVIGYI
ncbi:hypothetical protein CLV59_102558 [Chitinophaga dinghuensis]|uniref:Uncharacterized protein n=1 Tax=Chitinophaga dinghuensis TaxID=1539050 RepID=A0A327W9D8_9BACT|nr:hypothetical protein [Chitinophaga dinghuensis]RAJ85852.1 hypothetical protein CLV59_102558 [Chitinophaga dinghuensis]